MMHVQSVEPMTAGRSDALQRVEQDHGVAAAGQRYGNQRTCGHMGVEHAQHVLLQHGDRVVGSAPHGRQRPPRSA
jgi:hypothetical protein